MRQKEDLRILNLLEEENREEYMEKRDELRHAAKAQILKVQEENRQCYNQKRKESVKYEIGDMVAIKRTQFGTNMKLRPRFLGPYKVVGVKGKDRYDVQKASSAAEGPLRTSSSADNMKRWPQ